MGKILLSKKIYLVGKCHCQVFSRKFLANTETARRIYVKKKLVATIIFVFLIMIVSLFVLISIKKNYIDTSIASEISLKYYYNDKKSNLVVTDKNDIKIIKESFKGISYKDTPSCGFSSNISIKLSNGKKEFIFCPACDGCSTARIGNSNKYVRIKDRNALETVLEKYGFYFPCV